MQNLTSFVQTELIVLLVGLAAIVAYQLLTGKVNMGGLLLDKTDSSGGGYSPARLQLLLITLAGAFYLFSEVVNNIKQKNFAFPDVDQRLFLLLGASHSFYLGGKVNSLFNLFGKPDPTPNSTKGDSQ